MTTVCTGFPPDWPATVRERFLESFAAHWSPAVELVADNLSQGGGLDRHRLIIPAAVAADLENGDLVAWLDPTVETLSAVPGYVLPQLVKDADLCFASSSAGDPNPAFWAVRLSPAVRLFLSRLAFQAQQGAGVLEAWAAAAGGLQLVQRDLNPGRGEAWEHGPLGRYTRLVPVA